MVSKEQPGGVMTPIWINRGGDSRTLLVMVRDRPRKRVGATAVESAIKAKQGLDEAAENRGATETEAQGGQASSREPGTPQAPIEQVVAAQQADEQAQPPTETEQ